MSKTNLRWTIQFKDLLENKNIEVLSKWVDRNLNNHNPKIAPNLVKLFISAAKEILNSESIQMGMEKEKADFLLNLVDSYENKTPNDSAGKDIQFAGEIEVKCEV